MPADRLMRIHSPEFQTKAERVLRVAASLVTGTKATVLRRW